MTTLVEQKSPSVVAEPAGAKPKEIVGKLVNGKWEVRFLENPTAPISIIDLNRFKRAVGVEYRNWNRIRRLQAKGLGSEQNQEKKAEVQDAKSN